MVVVYGLLLAGFMNVFSLFASLSPLEQHAKSNLELKVQKAFSNQDRLDSFLKIAVLSRDVKKIQKYVLDGANPNQIEYNPLLYAVQDKNEDLVRFLLINKADPDCVLFDRRTPMIASIGIPSMRALMWPYSRAQAETDNDWQEES
jgi:hypothetical protein